MSSLTPRHISQTALPPSVAQEVPLERGPGGTLSAVCKPTLPNREHVHLTASCREMHATTSVGGYVIKPPPSSIGRGHNDAPSAVKPDGAPRQSTEDECAF